MTASQAILVVISVALTVVTYLWAPLHSPEKKNAEQAVQTTAGSDFDFEAYRMEELKKLSAEESAKYQALQQELETASDKAAVLTQIASLLESNHLNQLAAFARKEAAAIANTEDTWLTSARELYDNAFTADNPSLTEYMVKETITCYEKALELNPENTDAKISMAVAYLEGQTEPMKGVMLLREITDQDPDNITANLILGKYGIVSGQFDKAVQRLQKVLSVDSLNVDACLYLARAYEGMGDKAKAIETLERCKSLVNDSGFSNEISSYIERLRNS